MAWSRLDLGVGIIVAPGLDLMWDGICDLVDLVEVEPQTMWRPRPEGGWDLEERAFQWVEGLDVPALVHGVGFPVGGCEPPDPDSVALTAACAGRLGAAHWSEHLSFNRAVIGGRSVDAGFLLPPAQTAAGVEAAVSHVAAYHAAVDLPFLVETGVNYLRPRPGDLSDGAFIADVAERGDCGILLDLHNLLANQRNGRQPVAEVLSELLLERVLEVHVAGGLEIGSYYLDAHIGPPDDELLALIGQVFPRLPNLRAVIYEAVPESLVTLGIPGVRDILTTLHRCCEGRGYSSLADHPHRVGADSAASRRPAERASPGAGRPAAADVSIAGSRARRPLGQTGLEDPQFAVTRDWERRLAAYTSRASDDRPSDDPGLDLLRRLTDAARLGELTLARPDLLGRLIATAGVEPTEQLLYQYLNACTPQRWTIEEGAQFASWLTSASSSG